jgi:hypothetical protein
VHTEHATVEEADRSDVVRENEAQEHCSRSSKSIGHRLQADAIRDRARPKNFLALVPG